MSSDSTTNAARGFHKKSCSGDGPCTCAESRPATTTPPTIAEVYDRLRDEYDTLGQISYHGTSWGQMCADLTREDIESIRSLLRDTGAAIEGLS